MLASAPSLLRAVLPSASICWCFDRPRFGAEFVPDFLLAHFNSAGYHWVLVELESPTHPALTQAGRISGKVTEAMRQIGDWRAWLRENIARRSTAWLKAIKAGVGPAPGAGLPPLVRLPNAVVIRQAQASLVSIRHAVPRRNWEGTLGGVATREQGLRQRAALR